VVAISQIFPHSPRIPSRGCKDTTSGRKIKIRSPFFARKPRSARTPMPLRTACSGGGKYRAARTAANHRVKPPACLRQSFPTTRSTTIPGCCGSERAARTAASGGGGPPLDPLRRRSSAGRGPHRRHNGTDKTFLNLPENKQWPAPPKPLKPQSAPPHAAEADAAGAPRNVSLPKDYLPSRASTSEQTVCPL